MSPEHHVFFQTLLLMGSAISWVVHKSIHGLHSPEELRKDCPEFLIIDTWMVRIALTLLVTSALLFLFQRVT